jgi:hypothetical protein
VASHGKHPSFLPGDEIRWQHRDLHWQQRDLKALYWLLPLRDDSLHVSQRDIGRLLSIWHGSTAAAAAAFSPSTAATTSTSDGIYKDVDCASPGRQRPSSLGVAATASFLVVACSGLLPRLRHGDGGGDGGGVCFPLQRPHIYSGVAGTTSSPRWLPPRAHEVAA